MNKLKHRLTFIFILFSLIIVLSIGTVANISIKKNFNKYIEEGIEQRKEDVVKSIDNTYKNKKFDIDNIDLIGTEAIEKGLILNIKDENGKVLWNAREKNNLLCESILKKMKANINKINPTLNGTNTTIEKFNLKSNGENVGSVEIEYIGPFYYNDSDLIFFSTLNNVLIAVGVFAVALSAILGITISHSISKPVLNVVNATNLIADGDYSNKVNVKSKIEEINNMINSVNKLANNLEEQENLRKILTRDISHELRTPLTTISVQVEALIDGIWEPTEERLKSIYDEIERLTRLVGSLEKLSTYEEDNFLINKESVGIKDIINTLIINFEKQLLDKKIELILNLNSITIYCDNDKISQAIINILSNSIKYSNEGGKIYINTFDDKEYNYISIKDTGIGIDKNDIKYIFERFYRVDKSRDRKSGGIGVGLTIAKTIVEKHSGTIIVKSKINNGSEFIIKLPK
ncbi:sensor histidine kinase [Clostridium baratii]|uniref:histidine kinase n=1 Tax=Clostridium baratii TaxID=1561 RepID=A0A174RDE4_9CLOT|nr:ATP-binding protein [Clostridium baratii]CUP83464.1 sensor histidine kinase [Clostridium baratii]